MKKNKASLALIFFLSVTAHSRPLFSNDNPPSILKHYRIAKQVAKLTTRDHLAEEPTTKLTTDGRRFDANLGKRLPLLSWKKEDNYWSIGVDAGVQITLFQEHKKNDLVFSTEYLDGFFGVYIAKAYERTILMLRTAHLSSHLVDNHPSVIEAIPYSLFWTEGTIQHTQTFHRWRVGLQGSLGLNYKSYLPVDQPRALVGIDVERLPPQPRTTSFLWSFNVRRMGVKGQGLHYSTFLGWGQSKFTPYFPWRIGVSHQFGYDHRNQNFNKKEQVTSLGFQIGL